MKEFKLTYKFYIIFFLILAFPISYFSIHTETYLNSLTREDILFPLAGFRLNDIAIAVILYVLAYWLVDKVLWRIKGMTRFGVPPDVNGRFKGTLISSYDQDKTYDIFIEIKQTLNKVSLCLYRENSHSETLIAAIGKNPKVIWTLYYIYEHKIDPGNLETNVKDHTGVAFLEISNGGLYLRGSYYNNPERGRYGTIEAKRVSWATLGKYK